MTLKMKITLTHLVKGAPHRITRVVVGEGTLRSSCIRDGVTQALDKNAIIEPTGIAIEYLEETQ